MSLQGWLYLGIGVLVWIGILIVIQRSMYSMSDEERKEYVCLCGGIITNDGKNWSCDKCDLKFPVEKKGDKRKYKGK